jgi:hypothetical protein
MTLRLRFTAPYQTTQVLASMAGTLSGTSYRVPLPWWMTSGVRVGIRIVRHVIALIPLYVIFAAESLRCHNAPSVGFIQIALDAWMLAVYP